MTRQHPTIANLALLQRGAYQTYTRGVDVDGVNLIEVLRSWNPRGDDLRVALLYEIEIGMACVEADDARLHRLLKKGLRARWFAHTVGTRLFSIGYDRGVVIGALNCLSRDPTVGWALRAARASIRQFRREEGDHPRVMALGFEAGLHSVLGRHDEARKTLRRMLQPAEAVGAELMLALVRYELGTAEGEPELVRLAEAYFERAGMTTTRHAARLTLPGVFHVTHAK